MSVSSVCFFLPESLIFELWTYVPVVSVFLGCGPGDREVDSQSWPVSYRSPGDFCPSSRQLGCRACHHFLSHPLFLNVEASCVYNLKNIFLTLNFSLNHIFQPVKMKQFLNYTIENNIQLSQLGYKSFKHYLVVVQILLFHTPLIPFISFQP